MPEFKPRRRAAYYHLTFFDDSWDEIPILGRQFVNAHDLFHHLEQWNAAQQALVRNRDIIPSLMASATNVSIMVNYGEDQEKDSNGKLFPS